MIDFSDIETTQFEFKIANKDSDKPPLIIKLDFDGIAIDLQQALPTVFAPSEAATLPAPGEELTPPPSGLQQIVDSWKTGKTLPPHLPSFKAVIHALNRVFEIPEGYNPKLGLLCLTAWLQEQQRRMEVKKNIDGSPGSAGSTPEQSTPIN